MDLPELVLRPIGVVRSPFRERASAPRQPRGAVDARGTIELLPGHNFEDALCDLEGWEYLWVIFWFHLNAGWRPKVLPPRSERRRGLFATRTPHRPNPVGLSVVRLEAVEGLVLRVAELDILDGTPVLDLKPYVPWADAIPSARVGWLDPSELDADAAAARAPREGAPAARPADVLAPYAVTFAPRAAEQLAFLRERGVELEDPVARALALGPRPHPYRRIRPGPDGTATLALKDWRVRFRADERGRRVEVLALASGYRARELATGDDPALAAHRAFVARWSAA